MKSTNSSNLLQTENEQLNKLHQIVQDSIKQEELIIQNLLHPPIEYLSAGQKISDKVARFGGSWKFIILFSFILLFWIMFNSIAIMKWQFDPYPFILMNLVLSCVAAFQAPIIIMSQNRQEEKDRKQNENDYLINLKAEMQIRSLHQKIDLLLDKKDRKALSKWLLTQTSKSNPNSTNLLKICILSILFGVLSLIQ
jgi:uncharacterized membrane protein